MKHATRSGVYGVLNTLRLLLVIGLPEIDCAFWGSLYEDDSILELVSSGPPTYGNSHTEVGFWEALSKVWNPGPRSGASSSYKKSCATLRTHDV